MDRLKKKLIRENKRLKTQFVIFSALLLLLVLFSYHKGVESALENAQTEKAILVEEYMQETGQMAKEIEYLESQIELLSRSGRYPFDWQVKKFTITAYSPHDCPSWCGLCHDGDPSSTATGTYPTAGRTVAVDPEIIPLGSHVWIEGWGWRVAEDTGGAVKGYHVDICVEDHSICEKYGVQQGLVLWTP